MAVVTKKLVRLLLKKLTRGGSGGYKKMKMMNTLEEGQTPMAGFVRICVVGEEEDTSVKYDVPIELFHSKSFKDLLDEYEDYILANPNDPITLPCSVRAFEAKFNIVKKADMNMAIGVW